jgi:hypothetical protein
VPLRERPPRKLRTCFCVVPLDMRTNVPRGRCLNTGHFDKYTEAMPLTVELVSAVSAVHRVFYTPFREERENIVIGRIRLPPPVHDPLVREPDVDDGLITGACTSAKIYPCPMQIDNRNAALACQLLSKWSASRRRRHGDAAGNGGCHGESDRILHSGVFPEKSWDSHRIWGSY